jgi:hypothetical protein
VLGAIATAYGTGVYVKGKFERAAEADRLEKDLSDLKEGVRKRDEEAARKEAEVQALRKQAADINREWGKIRGKKDRSICVLDADTIRVLQLAGSADAR